MQNSIQDLFTELRLKDDVPEEVLKKLIDNELVSVEEVEEYKNDEFIITVSGADVNDLDIADSIDWTWDEFDELAYKDFISNLLYGKYFLVAAIGCRWNGANGYGFYTDMEDALYRGYDVDQYIKEKSDKYIKLVESSHDVPTGRPSYVVSLTVTERDKVRKWLENRDFEKIDEFVNTVVN